MSSIRVAVNGALGRMGKATVAAVEEAEGLELVAQADAGDALDRVLAEARADVCVDFTHPSVGLANTLAILEAGVRPVVGTTGFSPQDLEAVRAACTRRGLGAVIAPNFSIGAVLMMRFAREAAPFFDAVEIVELHHDRKADAPSGTAIATAEMIAASRSQPFRPDRCTAETVPGSRGGRVGEVRVHSVRLPGMLAHQEVVYGSPGETLRLKHDTLDRVCFMPGVVRAVRAVVGLTGLVVGIESILFPE